MEASNQMSNTPEILAEQAEQAEFDRLNSKWGAYRNGSASFAPSYRAPKFKMTQPDGSAYPEAPAFIKDMVENPVQAPVLTCRGCGVEITWAGSTEIRTAKTIQNKFRGTPYHYQTVDRLCPTCALAQKPSITNPGCPVCYKAQVKAIHCTNIFPCKDQSCWRCKQAAKKIRHTRNTEPLKLEDGTSLPDKFSCKDCGAAFESHAEVINNHIKWTEASQD